REHDGHRRDHPVPELDVRVVALGGERLPRLAPGPVLTAEPGARQPYDSARGHDQPEGEDRGGGDTAIRDGRELEGAQPGQARGVDVHGAECRPRYVSATPSPVSTRPIEATNKSRAVSSATSAGPFSAGREISRPPAVCGSHPSVTSSSGTPSTATY